ncbi:hypothetical protein C8B47_03765 [filamentous cyanobacterium CCP4]|nr:hypothetical protein C8B47_03765 [filamentous cyanobacterium CCP4]
MINGVKINVSVLIGGQEVGLISGADNLPDDFNRLKTSGEFSKEGVFHVAMEVDPDLMIRKIKQAVVAELRAMADKLENGDS